MDSVNKDLHQCFLVSCFNFSFSFSHRDTFSLSFSVVNENLLNFSFSFSQVLVSVTQISHQNECDHTK